MCEQMDFEKSGKRDVFRTLPTMVMVCESATTTAPNDVIRRHQKYDITKQKFVDNKYTISGKNCLLIFINF